MLPSRLYAVKPVLSILRPNLGSQRMIFRYQKFFENICVTLENSTVFLEIVQCMVESLKRISDFMSHVHHRISFLAVSSNLSVETVRYLNLILWQTSSRYVRCEFKQPHCTLRKKKGCGWSAREDLTLHYRSIFRIICVELLIFGCDGELIGAEK